ncbi:hypothetical protein QQP08_017294 [Theobroma cacao]|nr:hypothetical protein QQP08_017294 [Theobroma cacao]
MSLFTIVELESFRFFRGERRDPPVVLPTLLIALETNNRAYYDIFSAGQRFPTHQLVGFGRDQVTKECKIIRLFIPKEKQGNHIHECEVFALSSDPEASWRGLGVVAYFIRPAQQPVLVNGALHWILDIRHANPSEVIVSFDLHTENSKQYHTQVVAQKPQIVGILWGHRL